MISAVADTHTILWYVYRDARLSVKARNFISDTVADGDQIAVSCITLVEMVYPIEKGRIAAESLSRLIRVIEAPFSAILAVAVDADVARSLARVDVTQIPDMPDRIVAATALALRVPVISRDARIAMSSLSTIW